MNRIIKQDFLSCFFNIQKSGDIMKITIIHGQNHKGSTYRIATDLANKLNGEIKEFFLPKDFSDFCVGCTTCFMKDEKKCPHYEKLLPITNAILEADVLIFASPVYVYHVTAGMKNLLDHYGYLWMVHRPDESMFKKQAIVISTAAGAGMKSTIKDIKDSLFYWGVPKVYSLGVAVAATSYEGIRESKKREIEQEEAKIAKKVIKKNGKVKPGFKTKAFFFIMHLVQKNGWNETDSLYWKEKGWIKKIRPWKNR